jgi:hypothetical protein
LCCCCWPQKELTKKVQRIDSLQADFNKAADARTAAEAKAEELARQADSLRQQLAVLGSKDGELQTLAADLAAAASAKAALQAKVSAVCSKSRLPAVSQEACTYAVLASECSMSMAAAWCLPTSRCLALDSCSARTRSHAAPC